MQLKSKFPALAFGAMLLTGCVTSKIENTADSNGKPQVPINCADSRIKIDGKLDDWGKMTQNSVFLQQGINCFLGRAHSAQDAALVKTAYDNEAFYVAVKVADKSFVPAKTKPDLAKGDVIELFLDIRPVAPTKGIPRFRNKQYTKGVYQLRISAPDKDNKIAVWTTGSIFKEPPHNIKMAGKNTKYGYTLEVKMPFSGLFGKPAASRFEKPVGFEIMLCDVDKNKKGNTPAWYYSINRLGQYYKAPQNFCITNNVSGSEKPIDLKAHLIAQNKGIQLGQGFLDSGTMPPADKFAIIDYRYGSSEFDIPPKKNKKEKIKAPKFKSEKTKILKYPSLGITFYEKSLNIKNPAPGRYYVTCKFPGTGEILKQNFYGKRSWNGVRLYPIKNTNLTKQEAMELTEKSSQKLPFSPGWDFFPNKIELDENFVFTNAKEVNGKFQASMHPELLFYLSECVSGHVKEPAPVWGRIIIADKRNGKIIRQLELKPLYCETQFQLAVSGLKKGLYNIHFEFVTAEGKTYVPEIIHYERGSGVSFNTEVALGVVEPYKQILETSLKNANKLLTKAIYVGNAGKKQFPKDNVADCCARTVWDMQFYNGRVYIGDGDWNGNRGPIDIWSFKPEKGNSELKFKKEFTVDDESVDRFRVYDGKLLVPGIDSADKPPKGQHQWDLGNLYIKENGKWSKFRTVPHGIHVLDTAIHKGNIYVATGTESGGKIYESTDSAKTWRSLGDSFGEKGIRRFYQIIPMDDFLIAFTGCKFNVYICQNGKMEIFDLPCMPSCKVHYWTIGRLTRFKNGVVYTVLSTYLWDEKCTSNNLYWLDNFKQGAKLVECFKDSVVTDIIVRDDYCYVMTTKDKKSKEKKTFEASIFKSSNMKNWVRLAEIKELPAFPNSFEFADDYFYIGIASSEKEGNKASGNIYKLAY